MENKNRWDFFSTIIFCGRKIRVLCCIYKYDIVTFGGVVFQQIVVIKRTILGVYTSVLSVIWASFWTTSSNVKRLSFEPLVPLASHPQSEKQFFHFPPKNQMYTKKRRNQTSDSTNVIFKSFHV